MANIKYGITETVIYIYIYIYIYRERERERERLYISTLHALLMNLYFYIFLTFSCYKMESVPTTCLGSHYAP